MKVKYRLHIFITLILAVSLCFPLFTGCSQLSHTAEPDTITGFYFNTAISVSIYDDLSDEDFSALQSELLMLCQTYEDMFSKEIDSSDVSKINSANGEPVTVSDETVDLLQSALTFSEMSGGAFSVSIAPVTKLWDITGENPHVPDSDKLEEALSHVNDDNIQINGNTVTLLDPEMQIDLGAIAKGYIADRLQELLIENNVAHAIINLGGNVLAIGGKTDTTPFKIGLQKPFDTHGEAIAVVSLSDGSVVTSGSYERYFEDEDGNFYHHIMDPATGYPVKNGLHAVTILSPDSVTGDALSTTLFSLGMEKGMELVDSMPDIYAIFIDDQGEMHYSSGLTKAYTIEK